MVSHSVARATRSFNLIPRLKYMTYYDLYGFEIEDIDDARPILADILQVRFHTHDSLYLGVYYMTKGIRGDKISIKRNFDPYFDPDSDPQEGKYLESDFQNVDVLIYVDGASAEVAKEYEERLSEIDKIKLLRRNIN